MKAVTLSPFATAKRQRAGRTVTLSLRREQQRHRPSDVPGGKRQDKTHTSRPQCQDVKFACRICFGPGKTTRIKCRHAAAYLTHGEAPPCPATHTTPVSARAHPRLQQQEARQHAPRARWRPAGRACAPRPAPRGPTAGTPSGRPRRAGGAHLAPRRAAAPGAGAMCPQLGSLQGRASCRPLGCRPRRRRAPAGRRCKVAAARSATCGNRSEPRRRPALEPSAGTYTWHRAKFTWHRAKQSRWSPAPGALRRAPRSATPLRPFRQTAKNQNFGFTRSI
jgi:hypothetical protein